MNEKKPEVKATEEMSLLRRLAMFQREDIEIPKSKKAHGYSYAPLDIICTAISPYMEKHGIGYSHTMYLKDDNNHYLRTIIFNEFDDEDFRECETRIDENVELVKQNKFMVMGSAVTYFRRYHLVTLLGLTTDEDTDAGGALPNQEKPAGRSVEAAGLKEGETNYVTIFTNLISKKKTEVQVRQSFEIHKKNMNPEVLAEIEKLIVESFKPVVEDGSK